MKEYTIPVTFFIKADSPEAAYAKLNNMLNNVEHGWESSNEWLEDDVLMSEEEVEGSIENYYGWLDSQEQYSR